jgi:hypothetical protein
MADQDKNGALSQLYLLMQAAQRQGNSNAPVAVPHGGNLMDNIAAIQNLLAIQQQQSQQQPQPSAARYGGNILAALRQYGISPNMSPLPQHHTSSINAQSIQCQSASQQNGNNGGMDIVQLALLESMRRQQNPAAQQAFYSAPAGLHRPFTNPQAVLDQQVKAFYQGSVQPLAAVSSANLNNDESAREENKRKTVPCRARGMPQDHNFKVSLSLELANLYRNDHISSQ